MVWPLELSFPFAEGMGDVLTGASESRYHLLELPVEAVVAPPALSSPQLRLEPEQERWAPATMPVEARRRSYSPERKRECAGRKGSARMAISSALTSLTTPVWNPANALPMVGTAGSRLPGNLRQSGRLTRRQPNRMGPLWTFAVFGVPNSVPKLPNDVT